MKKSFLFLVLLCLGFGSEAQNISGIINSYAAVTAINYNVLTVTSTSGFAVGDKVLIIRMKGAQVNQTNTAAYGDTVNMNETGRYTFSNIIALTANSITLSPFCDIFGNPNFLQVVTVPQYNNPVVTATLGCQPWNGATGGILIFETPNTLTLNADINVSGLGYRGGDVWGSTFSCGTTNYFSAQAVFGPEGKKGEGVANHVVGQECGRGKLANGGGGAFAGNAGAGGGGNGGAGGNGGNEYNGCPTVSISGIGGMSIQHISTRLFMGGGGGGPQSDNAQQVYNGGNGGGIVFIKANQIVGNGFSIESTGESTPQINDEGAPGGGAGGSVYLVCPTFTGNLDIYVPGGNGSSNNNVIFPSNCHGPGGGGGGGLVWFSGAATPAGVTIVNNGGQAGFVLNPSSPCYNTHYGAQNGSTGQTKFNFVPTPPPVLPTVDLGPDTLICAGASINLNAGPGFSTYFWDDASTNQIRSVNAVGTYYVTITTFAGCTASDTINVLLDTSVVAGFDPIIRLGCENDTVFMNSNTQGATQYLWYFGDGDTSMVPNPTHVYQNQGNYVITLICGNPPCFDTLQKVVNLQHPINAVFTSNTDSLCVPENFIVTSGSQPNPTLFQHTWIWGDGTPNGNGVISNHNYTQPGDYTVTLVITDTLGCTDTARMVVHVELQPALDFVLSKDVVCVGDPISCTQITTPNINSWIWTFGDGSQAINVLNPNHVYDVPGAFAITLTGQFNACQTNTLSATKNVMVYDYPALNLGPDTSICPGITGSILLTDLNNSGALYSWSNGSVANAISVVEAGIYWVKATTPGSSCSTTDSIVVARDCYINVPNVFSPDGDGLNDYFLPRDLLSSGLKSFNMAIYNRWGEKVFTTNAIDGRGWDGRLNGVPQAMGVYVYTIEVEFINKVKKSFQGNVTLMR